MSKLLQLLVTTPINFWFVSCYEQGTLRCPLHFSCSGDRSWTGFGMVSCFVIIRFWFLPAFLLHVSVFQGTEICYVLCWKVLLLWASCCSRWWPPFLLLWARHANVSSSFLLPDTGGWQEPNRVRNGRLVYIYKRDMSVCRSFVVRFPLFIRPCDAGRERH